jgi:muramoyltetrapeptide carboxypeptidase
MSWRTLREGDLVGVIAPAGPSVAEPLMQVEPLLARHGLRTRLYPSCHACEGFLAGPDALRLADLHSAFADPEVAAVLCLRGGYGSGRLLDRIDPALLRAHDKPFVGYSDITAVHALRAREGLIGLHAPMPGSDLVKPDREADAQALFARLLGGWTAGEAWAPALDPTGLRVDGVAEGRLIGGNLSLVAALVGTPFAWKADGAILFLEDVGEEPYRVDRLLGQLRLAGVLDAIGAVLLGSFTEAESPAAVLRDYLAPLGKPVLGGWPSGHGTPNLPLPLGARMQLDATRGQLTLLQDVLRP